MVEVTDPGPLTLASPTVLVVDDEKNIRRTLEMVLSGEGYRVIEAERAEQALDIISNPEQPVDIVIFDLKLPGMSGLEALERIKTDEATRELPVIVVSGHATVHDAVSAIKLGASDFFEKPLNRERIVVSVHNSVRTARLSRAVEQLRAELQARYEMIGTKVQEYGNVAVLSYNLISHVTAADGKPGTVRWNSSVVYVRQDRGWRSVHSHWSYIRPLGDRGTP